MKITMALAVSFLFAASAFGQAAQQPTFRSQPHAILTSHAPVKAIKIPNWPADKPAPIIPIPTNIQSKPGLVTGIPRFEPSKPSPPCAVYNKNCHLLEATPPVATKPQQRTITKSADKVAPGS